MLGEWPTHPPPLVVPNDHLPLDLSPPPMPDSNSNPTDIDIEEEDAMPELVDASDEEEMQVVQELMAVDDDDSAPPSPRPQAQAEPSNTIPPPQQPAAEAGQDARLPGIRQMFEDALRNGGTGPDAPVTISMDFTFQLPLVPAPPPHPANPNPTNHSNGVPIIITPGDFGNPAANDAHNHNHTHGNERPDPRTLLQALFGLMAGHGGEREDPERARTIVRGLEAVSDGMVKRLIRAEEGTCAVCMESLEDDALFGQDAPASENAAPESTNATSDAPMPSEPSSSTPATPEPPLPRVVALPCAHVFHTACLTPWLARQTTCPNCRFDLDPDSLTLSIPPAAEGQAAASHIFNHLFGGLPPLQRVHTGVEDGFNTFVTTIRRRDAPPAAVATNAGPPPPAALERLPTATLERMLLAVPPHLRPHIEGVLARRRASSQVQRGEGQPAASTPTPPTTTTTAAPPTTNPALSPAAQALLTAHARRVHAGTLQAQARAFRAQAQEHRDAAAAIAAQMGDDVPEELRQRQRDFDERARVLDESMRAVPPELLAAMLGSASEPVAGPSAQSAGEGGPTQPGAGPLMSLFARQFADLLQRGIEGGMAVHQDHHEHPPASAVAGTSTAPAAQPQPVPTSAAQQPAPATQPQPTPQPANPLSRIQMYSLAPGQTPPPPPPGFTFVDIVVPHGGGRPYALHPQLQPHPPQPTTQTTPGAATAGAEGTGGEGEMDVDAHMGDVLLDGLLGGIARAMVQAHMAAHHPQGASTTPPGSPPASASAPATAGSSAPPSASASATVPPPTPAAGGSTVSADGVHLAPDGTLALAADTQATSAEQAQPRRTDSPARARTGRVASGSVPSVVRINPSGPSTPVRISTEPPTAAPAAGPSAPSARPSNLPIAALPFPLTTPAPVATPAQPTARASTRAHPGLGMQYNRAGLSFTPLTGPGGRAFGGIVMITPQALAHPAAPQPQNLNQAQQPVFGPAPPPGHAATAATAAPNSLPFGPGVTTDASVFNPVAPSGRAPRPQLVSVTPAPAPAPAANPTNNNTFTFGPAPGAPNPFSFGPAPQPQPVNGGGAAGMPRVLQDLVLRDLMGMMMGGGVGVEVVRGDGEGARPVAPLPRRARSVPPGAAQPAQPSQAQAQAQAQVQEGEANPRDAPGAPRIPPRPAPASSASAPRRKWAPPPPPGLTLRQRVEASERARGARCDMPVCVYAPSDERPEGGDGGALGGVQGCGHMYHAGCVGEKEKCVACETGEKESVREGKRKRDVEA
ncbi:unnamed protein product [Peniophora sp. CBMAI 1063]|nr:unnamed protein product [Peniophora sp. CBMAI 1063]